MREEEERRGKAGEETVEVGNKEGDSIVGRRYILYYPHKCLYGIYK